MIICTKIDLIKQNKITMYQYDSIEENEVSSEILILTPKHEIETILMILDDYLTKGTGFNFDLLY